MKRFATLALVAALPLFTACQRDTPPPAPPGTQADVDAAVPETALGRTVARAMDKARTKMHEGNLSLNGGFDVQVNGSRIQRKTDGLPAAEITPDGELIVAGTTVAMDERSRALARDYREGILAVASAGMDLGVQGADLGMKAAGDAIASIFRGDTEQVEERIEAEARKLEAAAMQLCDSLPQLLQAQQALAAAVPEFAPYAHMDAGDIEDCHTSIESGTDDDAPTAPADPAAEADAAASAV